MARLGEIAIYPVHLDPYASAGRVKQLRTLTADLASDTHNIILGDVNLAPRPSDGRIGTAPAVSPPPVSAFTQLMQEHDLVDAIGLPSIVRFRAKRGPGRPRSPTAEGIL